MRSIVKYLSKYFIIVSLRIIFEQLKWEKSNVYFIFRKRFSMYELPGREEGTTVDKCFHSKISDEILKYFR